MQKLNEIFIFVVDSIWSKQFVKFMKYYYVVFKQQYTATCLYNVVLYQHSVEIYYIMLSNLNNVGNLYFEASKELSCRKKFLDCEFLI
jgi:hypothetical protein